MGLLLRFKAAQLRKPFGFVGKTMVARYLNRLNEPINLATLQRLELRPDDQVIEIGFGAGSLIGHMVPVVADGRVVGVDYSPDMVSLCSKRFSAEIREGRVELMCARAESLPCDSESFTRACTVNTLYFWSDPSVPLAELHRVLKLGGRLVISFSPRETMENLPVTEHGFTLFEPSEVRSLLEDAGFSDVTLTPGQGPRGEFMCASATKGSYTLRPAVMSDFGQILRLNAEWAHFTSELDEPALARLHEQAAYHKVVESSGRVVAFLLALREGADYTSPNFRWFDERGGTFVYIDRVIVKGAQQGRGLAKMLYDDVFSFAASQGVERVVCELDIDPPNEASRRFHDTYGFREVGTQMVADGTKRVSLLEATSL